MGLPPMPNGNQGTWKASLILLEASMWWRVFTACRSRVVPSSSFMYWTREAPIWDYILVIA